MSGIYTDIVEIDAPSSAVAGERVPVTVRVKNTHTFGFRISVAVTYDTSRFIGPDDKWVAAGATESWSGSFIMPASDVTIWAYSSYRAEDGFWYLDDEMSKDVNLAEVFEGTISRKELEHDGTYDPIPVYNVPQDERGLVHIWGRNDMSTTQRMGISWVVKDPDGRVVEEHSEWEMWPYTSPGNSHRFTGGRFDLDKPGTYTINIALSMNPSDPEIVDTYYGTLCTVAAAVPEPEFSGFGIAEYQKV